MQSDEPRWRHYLRLLWVDVQADRDDGSRHHLETRERDLAENGLAPRAAREAAFTANGNDEEVRERLLRYRTPQRGRTRGADWLDGAFQDVRYGVRKLARQPGFTIAAAMVLALGIGATAAVFSAVDAILLQPLPFADDARLITLRNRLTVPLTIPGVAQPKSSPDVTDLDHLDDVFSGYAVYATGGLNLTGVADPVRLRVATVTPTFFPVLGVLPAHGRPILPEEGISGVSGVAVLSDALVRREFGDAESALGRTVELNGRPFEVVGIMPRDFRFPADSDVWLPQPVPMTLDDFEPFRQSMPAVVIARLAPGVSLDRAETRVRSLFASYGGSSAERAEGAERLVEPLRDQLVGDRRNSLLILFGATLLVLLVASANVANLLLAKAAARRPEIVMRGVLGASWWRITQQLGIESVILAGIGAIAGLGTAFLCLIPLRTLIPTYLVGSVALAIDLRVLAFTLIVVLFTSLVFGLCPIIASRRIGAADAVGRLAGSDTGDRRASRTRRVIVVGELAVALMLLIGTGVMLRSLGALAAVDPGIRPEEVSTLELTLARASTPEEIRTFMESVLSRLDADPRVESAAFVNELPLRGEGGISVPVSPDAVPQPDRLVGATLLAATPSYFPALGIPVLRGRSFLATTESHEHEVVINELLAERLWPGEDPIGKRLWAGGTREVVGVVGNVKGRFLEGDFSPQIYLPLTSAGYNNLALVARSGIRPSMLNAALREAVRAVDPGQAVYNEKTMEEVIAEPLAPRRTNTTLISIFGILAIVLASIGVYGVLSFDVTQRSRELSIRVALGASPLRVLRYVMGGGFRLALLGGALGLGGAWLLVRFLDSFLYGISPRDPVTFVAAPIVLMSVAVLATLLPAWRATRIDPAAVMKG